MLQVLARFTVVVCALFAAQAYALGLGDINVKSKLNERFSATIPVLGATAAQIDAFSVKLASSEDFNRAGIERSEYLSSLHFEVQEAPGGARVMVSSEQIAREPFLNFIVEARSPDGKLLREYTVLLDPPTLASDSSAPAYTPAPAQTAQAPAPSYTPPPPPVQKVPGPAPASSGHLAPDEAAQLAAQMPGAAKGKPGKPAKGAKAPKTAPAPPAPAAVAEAPPPAPVAAAEPAPAAASTGGGATYGPTAPQETFWSIGVKLRPNPKVTMDQVLLAIYRANPGAFDKGSFNGLLKGRVLQVPSEADMESTPPAEAKSLVESWRHGAAPGGLKKSPEPVAAAPAALPKAEKPAKAPKIKQGKPLPPLEPIAPAPLPAPAPAAVTPPPAPTPAPAPKAAAPTPPPAPAPAAPATSPAPAAAAKPAPSTPAPAPAATTPPPAAAPGNAAPTPAAVPPPQSAPAEAAKPKPLPPPPAPEPGFFDEYGSLIGIVVFAVVVGLCGLMIFRRKKPVLPDFGAKLPSVGGFGNPFARKAAPEPKAPPPVPPALAPKKGPPGPPPMPKPQALKLGDTTALPDEPAQDATQEFARTQIGNAPLAGANDTAKLTPPPLPPKAPEPPAPPKPGDTAVLAPPQRVLQESIPQATPPPLGGEGGDVDFDLTSQFEAQTLSINLDANDPLSEADFHLAYGLYDEAASLLKQALVKEPKRQDLRVKLAETYFAGGKPLEFQETAEALHGQVSPAEWQKIAIMGRQLSPDAALFKNDGTAAAPDVDLTLGDSIGPAAAQVIGAAPHAGGVIDFDLDSELAKSMPATPAAKPAAPAAPAAAPKAESGEFDLSHFDLGTEPTPAAGGDNTIEFDLDELDLSKPAAGGAHIASGDEIGTKLDLARVYADMGDNDAARGLLNEVLGTGNAAQKGEAEALLKRLSA